MTRKTKPPVALYSALADATRCRIIEILRLSPVPVHQLADGFSISRPAISRHLRVLKTAGLVAEVKKGRENVYALRADRLGKALGWIEAVTAATAPAQPAKSPSPATPPAPEPAPAVPAEIAAPTRAARPRPEPRKQEPPINQMGFDF